MPKTPFQLIGGRYKRTVSALNKRFGKMTYTATPKSKRYKRTPKKPWKKWGTTSNGIGVGY